MEALPRLCGKSGYTTGANGTLSQANIHDVGVCKPSCSGPNADTEVDTEAANGT